MSLQMDPQQNEIKHLLEFIEIFMDDLLIAKKNRPLELTKKISFVIADSVSLPFADESIDTAILSWSL